MGLFWHTHKWTEFVCTLKDLGYPRLIQKIYSDNRWENKKDIAFYGRDPKHNQVFYPSNGKVIYKSCECGSINIKITDGSGCDITFESHFIRVLVEQFKKKKQEEETERLLNYGNVDYQKLMEVQNKLKYAEETIEEYKNKINEVQDRLKDVHDELTKSQENDAIWAVIPKKVKQDLYKKYGNKIKNELETQ